MSKPKITSTIDYLSDPRKGITAAVLLVLAIAAVWFFWSKIKQLWGGSSLKTTLDNSAIESATGTTITPTLQFHQLANRIWEATVAYAWGTNEEEVYAVLGCLNTPADYIKLENAWVDNYNATSGWNKTFGTFWQARATLPAVLQSELNGKELAQARSILTAKGITPDF